MKNIQPKDFGKDHWSLLAYVEARCVDYEGILDKRHLRIKNSAIGNGTVYSAHDWKPEWGTVLAGYFKEDGITDKTRKLPDHDDLDCLDDLEHTGYIKNIGTGFNPAYKITKLGNQIALLLHQHKQEGKHYASFTIN